MNRIEKTLSESSLWSVIDDKSIIDTDDLNVNSIEEANSFLEGYGFDYNSLSEREELASIRKESIAFLEDVLLVDGQEIPPPVLNETDVRQLLIGASRKDGTESSKWCCALLRVMHTFAHCGTFFTEHYEDKIHKQIMGRFQPHIRYDGDKIFIGDIELVNFESRPVKSKQSVVLKMLHKVENVSTEIFDWFGIRFVTRDRLDVIKVLEYLIQHDAIMPANIKASRSRNTLLDVEQIKSLAPREGDLEGIRSEIQMLDYPKVDGFRSGNPYSGATYHAIQFTCRHRVRIDESDGREIRFFFPYEIQILDEDSFAKSRSGLDSHEQYKKRQLAVARRRVLHSIKNPT
ncbi:MAG: TIGR04552 family protein [Rhodospirillales bacterium]|nr:TIGR04552 family protein [Rhodospirillales bacterium]